MAKKDVAIEVAWPKRSDLVELGLNPNVLDKFEAAAHADITYAFGKLSGDEYLADRFLSDEPRPTVAALPEAVDYSRQLHDFTMAIADTLGMNAAQRIATQYDDAATDGLRHALAEHFGKELPEEPSAAVTVAPDQPGVTTAAEQRQTNADKRRAFEAKQEARANRLTNGGGDKKGSPTP